jgi:hypothetical protein
MSATPPPTSTSQSRGCLSTLVVFLLMIGIVVGGYIATDALANEPPKPVSVSHGVSLVAPWDWQFGGRSTDGDTILLSRGNGSLAITVVEGNDAAKALNDLRQEWEADGSVSTSEITPVTGLRPAGQETLRFAYSGSFPDIASSVEGEVTAVAGNNVVVLFDGWASQGDYVMVRDEIATMIQGATIP